MGFRGFRVFGLRRRAGRKCGIHGIPRKIFDFGFDFFKVQKCEKYILQNFGQKMKIPRNSVYSAFSVLDNRQVENVESTEFRGSFDFRVNLF